MQALAKPSFKVNSDDLKYIISNSRKFEIGSYDSSLMYKLGSRAKFNSLKNLLDTKIIQMLYLDYLGMLKRKLEETIKAYLSKFPCVVLIGARQVGKSTLLKKVLPKAKFFDLEDLADYDYIKSDPKLFLNTQASPLVIDEAQLCPDLFKALRVKIDEDRSNYGRFLLSGSSSPHLLSSISESLAGRVAIIEVPCLSWDEALEKKASKFYSFIEDPSNFPKLKPNYKIGELFEMCFYGLYPEAFTRRNDEEFYRVWQENYFKTYIERDIRSLFPGLELENYRRLIMMLCHSSGDSIKYSQFAASLGISEPTVKKYLEIAEGTFIWSKLRAFDKNSKKRLIKMPKGYLRDTVLINYMNKFTDIDQMLTKPNFGLIWESFIIEQLEKNLRISSLRPSFFYYRTQNKAEIDLIIETSKSLIPVEIKTSSSFKKEHLTNLNSFIEEFKSSYGLLINNGSEVRQIAEKVYQIPSTFL